MEKKQYTMPAMKVYPIMPTAMICGSGQYTMNMLQGASGDISDLSIITQDDNTGIFGE